MTKIILTEEQIAKAVALWCEKNYPVEQLTTVNIVFEVSNLRARKPIITAHVEKVHD